MTLKADDEALPIQLAPSARPVLAWERAQCLVRMVMKRVWMLEHNVLPVDHGGGNYPGRPRPSRRPL